ncbi:MAG: response regulator transcription factor [Bacteroidetes bacterium]|nr:MAG: response regulator transcription factor [Bacteroidota bacterium]
MKPRILLLEDEDVLRQTLVMNLQLENYAVHATSNGEEAIRSFAEGKFDLCILDVMVPEIDGHGVCQNIRNQDSNIPILFLSALNGTDNRLQGLKNGADDYIGKPFNLDEMLLKIDRLIQKNKKIAGETPSMRKSFNFGDNVIHFDSYEAEGVSGPFQLTKKEILLLRLFVDFQNEVIPREKILHAVWGYSVYPNTRTIDNFILGLRKYFEEDPSTPRYFRSVRGVGYRFTPDGF